MARKSGRYACGRLGLCRIERSRTMIITGMAHFESVYKKITNTCHTEE